MNMNGKIPVFGAVASAYGFAFGRFFTVLRLSWFWLAVVTGLSFYWGPTIMAGWSEGLKALQTGGPEAMQAAMSGIQFEANMLSLVSNLAQIFIVVALIRAIVSQDFRDGVPLHIISGMPDLRVIGVYILLLIAIIAATIGIGIVFGVVSAILAQVGAGALVGILALILVVLCLWVALRLSLVLPVAAVESNLGVERSWELMKGNSLRMLLALLLTFIPFAVAVGFVFTTLVGPDLLQSFPAIDPNASPQAMQSAVLAWVSTLFEHMKANWALFAGASVVVNLLYFGLMAGLLGRAYRATTGMDG